MAKAQCAEAHLQDDKGQWVGKLCLYALVARHGDEAARAYMEATPLVLQAHQTALAAQQAMADFIGEAVPVLEQGKLIGIIHEADLFAHARMVTRSIWQHDHDDDVRDRAAFDFGDSVKR
jgi:Mg/Co/Ni transporter MgtE